MFDSIDIIRPYSSFSFSPENTTGEKSGGSRGKPWQKVRPYLVVKPGETITLAEIDGPGKIQSLWFGGDTGPYFILRIYWEGQSEPSVECPLSAFFGYGYNENVIDAEGNFPTLNSAMVLVAPCRGLNCYWPMPFRKHCLITLENRSPAESHGTHYQVTGIRGPVPEDAGYFHASYRQEKPHKPDDAYVVIDGIQGRGHYAGTSLFAGVNGPNGCWVEGEAMMYIDGDEYPTINYTGTEDYFCGSYGFAYDNATIAKYTTYSGHFVGMYAVLGSPAQHYGYQPRFMMYRWHIPDPIYFEKDFRMVLQNMRFTPYGHRPRYDDLASVAYWYQTLPAAPLKTLPPDEELDVR